MYRIAKNSFLVLVLGSLFFLALVSLLFMFPQNASAAANITLVSAQIATSSGNHVLVQLENPNATTLSSLTAASWHIDINGGGSSATTSQTATILESSYPFTIRLTFQGPLAASYSAALGLYVDASGVTDSGSNTNAVVGHASSIAVAAVDTAGPTLSPVTIASSNASTTLAKSADTVTVSFTSNKAIFTPGSTTTIGTHTATVSRTSPTVWTASTAMDSSDTDGSNVSFLIANPKSIQGVPAANVTAITSGANVMYDRSAPTISLTGSASDSVFVNRTESYTDPGATISDSREGTLSSLVTTGSVNRTTVGTYTLTYNASDSVGNAATAVSRTVTVNHIGSGGIFTGSASSLPDYKPPRSQITYPDGRVVYLDETSVVPATAVTTITPAAPASAPTPASTSTVFYTRTLRAGSSGNDVVTLQTFLEGKGFLKIPEGVAKGYFGSLTRQAVMKYQESMGIEAVGIVGPKTRAALNSGSGSH